MTDAGEIVLGSCLRIPIFEKQFLINKVSIKKDLIKSKARNVPKKLYIQCYIAYFYIVFIYVDYLEHAYVENERCF